MPDYILKRTLFPAIALSVYLFASSHAFASPELTDADKAAIIQAAMELRLGRVGPEEFAQFRIFATDNMSPTLLPSFSGVRFTLMREQLIERNKRRQKIFRYLRIGEFSNDGDSVKLSLGIIETRGGLGYHVHAYHYVFTKSDNRWQGKIVWVVC